MSQTYVMIHPADGIYTDDSLDSW